MEHSGIYLYGFVDPGSARGFSHPAHEEIGPVRILEIQDVAAMVSQVPLGAIQAGLAADPPVPDWIVPRALHHEHVLDKALKVSPILPVRFGCVFISQNALEEVARPHLETIRSFLRQMVDQEEWSLKVYLDEPQAVAFLFDYDPVLSEAYRRLPATPGTRYFLEKRLRDDAKRKALKNARSAADQLCQFVERSATAVKSLPLRTSEEGNRKLVLKLAILLSRSSKEVLFKEVEKTATGEGSFPLLIEPTGPWPPFHFCPILGNSNS